MIKALVALIVVGGLVVPQVADAKPPSHVSKRLTEVPVTVNDAWIHEGLPGAAALTGYMLITNPTRHTLALTGISCDAFGTVQMQALETPEGQSQLQTVPGFTIPPGGRLIFQPGGNQLALLGPKRKLVSGNVVSVVLDFGAAGRRSLLVKVLKVGITSETQPAALRR